MIRKKIEVLILKQIHSFVILLHLLFELHLILIYFGSQIAVVRPIFYQQFTLQPMTSQNIIEEVVAIKLSTSWW